MQVASFMVGASVGRQGRKMAFRLSTHSEPTMRPLPNTRCPLCGGANACAPAQAGTLDVECWCKTAPISAEALARVPPDQVNKSCLCPRCAAGLAPPEAP